MVKERYRRVFVNSNLLRGLHDLSKVTAGYSLGLQNAIPLYVKLHMIKPVFGVAEIKLHQDADLYLASQELEELSEEDTGLIRQIEAHPELFMAIPFELEDGTTAVAYDLARPAVYTMLRVQDEADWFRVMRTFDPTWLSGPTIPKLRKNKKPRRKISK